MSIPFRERLTCSIKEAAEATGLSRSYLYELIAAGRLRTKKFGYNRLVHIQSLLEMLEISPQIEHQQTRGLERTSEDGDGRSGREKH